MTSDTTQSTAVSTPLEMSLSASGLQSVGRQSAVIIIIIMTIHAGPALSGVLVKSLGFPAIVCGLGLFCFAFSPFLSFLENLPERKEKEQIELHNFVEGEKTEFPYESFIEEK